MIEDDMPLGLAGLVVPLAGAVEARGDPFEPYRLVDPEGVPVLPVTMFLAGLQACGRSALTQRSYSMALLRWFRFLWAAGVPWDQATRVEARDFVRWVQIAGKPARPHWRGGDDAAGARRGRGGCWRAGPAGGAARRGGGACGGGGRPGARGGSG